MGFAKTLYPSFGPGLLPPRPKSPGAIRGFCCLDWVAKESRHIAVGTDLSPRETKSIAHSAEIAMRLAMPVETESLWSSIHRDAVRVAAAEPILAAWMHEAIINQPHLGGALSQLIAVAVGGRRDETSDIRRVVEQAYRDDPALVEMASLDLGAPLGR